MNPEPPLLLSYWLGSGGIAGITEYQQVKPGKPNVLSDAQVPSGVGRSPMFSMATVKAGFVSPSPRVTGRPSSNAFLLNANSCAPLKPPPPMPGLVGSCGNSSGKSRKHPQVTAIFG